MKTAIDKLTDNIRYTEGEIAKTLAAYAGEVDRKKNSDSTTSTPYVSARPKLVGMEGAELTSGEGIRPE